MFRVIRTYLRTAARTFRLHYRTHWCTLRCVSLPNLHHIHSHCATTLETSVIPSHFPTMLEMSTIRGRISRMCANEPKRTWESVMFVDGTSHSAGSDNLQLKGPIMNNDRKRNDRQLISRRVALTGAAFVVGAAAAAATQQAAARQKISQADAKYQGTPKGDQRCDGCISFQPPNACKFVQATSAQMVGASCLPRRSLKISSPDRLRPFYLRDRATPALLFGRAVLST